MSSKTSSKKQAAEAESSGPPGGWGNFIGIALVVIVFAVALWGAFSGGGGTSSGEAVPLPLTSARPPVPAAPVGLPPQPAPARQGEPWEYDAATNKHFDPRPGHQHWHDGPPPPEGQRGLASSGVTVTDTDSGITLTPVSPDEVPLNVRQAGGGSVPAGGADGSPIQIGGGNKPTRTGAAWEYDAESGWHWDPRPGHEHWHRGQPPPEGQR